MTYSHLVLDEAHLVKNRATQRAKRLDAVAAQGPAAPPSHRDAAAEQPAGAGVAHTPGSARAAQAGRARRGRRDGDGEAADVGDGDGDAGLSSAARGAGKTILKPFILRRLKEEVATELIAKKREKRVEEMTEAQATLARRRWRRLGRSGGGNEERRPRRTATR